MHQTGVIHRRGFAIIVMIAAVALAAWLIQTRVGPTVPEATPGPGAAAEVPGAAAEAPAAAPSDSASASATGDGYGAANQGDGYGTDQAAGQGGAQAGAGAPVGNKVSGLVAKKVAKMGEVVQDDKGWTLYRFDKDTASPPTSNCIDACATAWPPVLAGDGEPQLTGIDASLVGTITRADGGKQLTLKGWPLYRYAADPKPGAWKGQGLQGTWFVIQPNGAKNLSCLPGQ